jgi:hypothetical protein
MPSHRRYAADMAPTQGMACSYKVRSASGGSMEEEIHLTVHNLLAR